MALKKSELYSSLWSSCDELRGGMDASQYKDYVLVLLFIKYVSDKYAGQSYAPITIPEGASFKDMVARKGKSDIGDQINKKIISPLANANKLSDMPASTMPPRLGSGKEVVERLTNLIAIIENKALDFSKNLADGDDILVDAYEYLMRHFMFNYKEPESNFKMYKNNTSYSMSFSTGTLFRQPSILIAKLHAELGDWSAVRTKALKNNLLQSRTNNTANRVCREIISRLKGLTPDQMSILTDGFPEDQGYILWAAVCKRYRFIHDFAVEVVHEKFLTMDLQLTHGDYDVFFNQKAEWHAEIVRIKASTRNKLRQVVFKMLREGELLSQGQMIIPTLLNPAMRQCIQDDPELTLAIFPVEDRKASL